MNGIHDLGGMEGFGPIAPEQNEPIFHAEWEKRVFGLFAPLSAAGTFCVDEFRHAIERMGAAGYLTSSYYEHWLHAFETLTLEKDVLTAEELRTGQAAGGARRLTPALAATSARAHAGIVTAVTPLRFDRADASAPPPARRQSHALTTPSPSPVKTVFGDSAETAS